MDIVAYGRKEGLRAYSEEIVAHRVLDELDWKELTAETIARAYGHGELWDKLIREVDDEKGR